jgi:hypothetical protein
MRSVRAGLAAKHAATTNLGENWELPPGHKHGLLEAVGVKRGVKRAYKTDAKSQKSCKSLVQAVP